MNFYDLAQSVASYQKQDREAVRKTLSTFRVPPITGVPEDQIPWLLRCKLVADNCSAGTPPGNFLDSKKLANQLGRLQGKLEKAAASVGTLNPKGQNANASGGHLLPAPGFRSAQPQFAFHAGNTELGKPYAATGDAAEIPSHRLLSFTFFLEDGRRIVVVESLADPEALVYQALVELGFASEELKRVGAVYAGRLARGSFLDSPDFHHKQLLFPDGEGGYVAVTPLPHSGLQREFGVRLFDRLGWRQAKNGRHREALDHRSINVGGTKPQNAGLLSSDIGGAMAHVVGLPPTSHRQRMTPVEHFRRAMSSGSLFPRWLARRLPADDFRRAMDRPQANQYTRRAIERAVEGMVDAALELAYRGLQARREMNEEAWEQALAALPEEERRLLDAGAREGRALSAEDAAALQRKIMELVEAAEGPPLDDALRSRFHGTIKNVVETL